MAPFFIFSGFIVHSVSKRIKCTKPLPFQRFHGNTDFPKNGLGQCAGSRTQYGSGDLGIEIQNAARNVGVQFRRIAAAVENHVANAFTDSVLEPSGNTGIVQFLQKAVLFVVQQVGKVVPGGFLRKLLGKCLYGIRERAIPVQQKPVLQCQNYLIFVLRFHLPKGNISIFPAVGIRDVKYIADAVGQVGVAQQSNAGGSPVYPASQTVPDIDFRTGGGIRTLGIDKHLFPEGVLIVPGSSSQESGVISGAGYNFPSFTGKQLRKNFIFSGHGFSLPHLNGNFHRDPAILNGGVQKPRSGVGNFRHHLIEPTYGSIDLFLTVGVIVPPLVAANGAAVLPQTVDFPAQPPSVNGKEPLQLTAVNGSFSTGMVLLEILADRCFLINCVHILILSADYIRPAFPCR